MLAPLLRYQEKANCYFSSNMGTIITIIIIIIIKFTLEQATKAQRGSRGIALLFP
jgi:hypothetical protein